MHRIKIRLCELDRTWNIDNRDWNWFWCAHISATEDLKLHQNRKYFIFISSKDSIVLMCQCIQAFYVMQRYIYIKTWSSFFRFITLLFSIVIRTSIQSISSTFYDICPICMYVSLDTQCQYKYWDYRYHQT